MSTKTAAKGRPPRVESANEAKAARARLEALIKKHNGNLSAMARAEKITRQSLAKHIGAHGLDDAAALARLKGGVSGARSATVGPGSEVAAKEKAAIERALRTSKTMTGAAGKLGITRSALNRKIAAYGIARPAA